MATRHIRRRTRVPSTPPLPPAHKSDSAIVRDLRAYHGALAARGCGEVTCDLQTCLIARQARLVLAGLDALDREAMQSATRPHGSTGPTGAAE